MIPPPVPEPDYVFATGPRAVFRSYLFHSIYSANSRRVLLKAGLRPGMRVAEFGCGPGASTRMLASMTGAGGHVTAIDNSEAQLEQAAAFCLSAGYGNVDFVHAAASETRLPESSFDLVYSRCLLQHLTDAVAGIREMRRVLKPGGVLVIEEAEFASASTSPASPIEAFATLLPRLGEARGVDFSLASRLYTMIEAEPGFTRPQAETNQPVLPPGEKRLFLKWSVEEASPALIAERIVSADKLAGLTAEMQASVEDAKLLVFAPRMISVWANHSVGRHADRDYRSLPAVTAP